MEYKYKESIKNAVNEMYSASFVDEENRKNELDEVYRKAEAWNELKEIINTSISLHRTSLPVDKYHGNLLKGQRDVLENVKRKMDELEGGGD